MGQYICFHKSYFEFVGGVKYKIKNITDQHYIVGKHKILKNKENLYYIGEVI